MNFIELEKIMSANGILTLADTARALNATPQAVSNWKARNQVPYHIVLKLKQFQKSESDYKAKEDSGSIASPQNSVTSVSISLSDILLTLAEQLKIIVLTVFVSVFIGFTYNQFILEPLYTSSAKVLLPKNKSENMGSLAGLVSQFGVSVPSASTVDLSSPSLVPELLRSRALAEKILDKEFYSKEHGKILPLLAILTHGNSMPSAGKDTLVTQALGGLDSMIELEKSPSSSFSVLSVTATDPSFAKKLAEVVLAELEDLNRFFKSRSVNEKTDFIEQRIANVRLELELSEQALKAFNEQNRQISSPSLQLQQERLERDVEIQKGIYLTLKQQLELAKIDEVQVASVIRVLDIPQTPLGPNNQNIKLTILVSLLIGLGLGIVLGFVRAYINQQDDIDERRKLRKVRNFFKKKVKDFIIDRRISGVISIVLIIGLPYYLGHQSSNPIYFGRYSTTLMLINSVYIIVLLLTIFTFFYFSRKTN